MKPFADRLAALVEERRSQICLGLDPDPAKLAGGGAGPGGKPPDLPSVGTPADGPAATTRAAAEAAGVAVAAHCRALIESAGSACVAVKPQLACFERLGAPGWAALEATVEVAQEAGLLVIADGKRGDVPVTAAAYAQALVGETPTPWGSVAGLGADAFTANPLLGRDALEPLLAAAAATGAGMFALVRTSNPGAADVEDLLSSPAGAGDGEPRPVHERLAEIVAELAPRLAGSGELSGLGAVVGATEPQHIGRLRELMPRSVFLIPGVGAQGGRPELLGPAFAAGPAAALVAASRGIAAADDPAAAAEELRAIVWKISGG